MRTACLKLIVAAGVCLFASVPTHAQPLISHNETESIESVVANADLVVIGKLLKIGRGTPADERTLNVEGREKHEVTIAVEETLKQCISSTNKRDETIGLYLEKTGVTDAGLEHLAGLKKLTELDLGETRMTDAGLKHLAGLTDLCSLRLEDTQVADAGLKDLAPLKKLTELDLRGTRVTDAGLEVLAGFTNLEKLLLYKSLATDKGIAKLRKARPKLDVHF